MKNFEEIIKLEKIYDIELKQLLQHENIMSYEFRNHYEVNEEKEIIGLNLSGNDITEIKGLENFTQLSVLDLSGNQITEIDNLEELKQLSFLNLSGNRIKEIKNLKELKQLLSLHLSGNQITEINNLDELKKLSSLHLSVNRITEIKNLKELKYLSKLFLSRNQIKKVENLENLKRLSVIDLSGNQIMYIKNLEELKNISTLNLSYNEIKQIKNLEELEQLSTFDLSFNQISDITILLKMKSLKNVKLEGNPKIEIDYPKEVLNAGWEAIKQFSEKSKEKIVFRNVKVLLLGNPNIGKSNLLEYLQTNQKPILKNSTHGVQYKKINFNDTNFHVWDFGGQEYFHATHQLFFSNNAINVILWGKDIARENINERCFDIDYWLRIVQQLNGNSKEIVFLTENKIDLNMPKFSEKYISKEFESRFQNLIFYENHISLTELKNLNGYKEKLINISEEIISRFTYPQFYEVFWKRIESIEKDYVTIEEINNRPHKENVISAMKVFHNMGMLLYFHNILPDKVFVKPQILLELLYQRVLSNSKKYKITQQEIAELIQNNTLDLVEQEIIVLLKHFNLVFEIEEDRNCYFIPQYLPDQNETQKYYEKLGFDICNIKIKADHYLVSLAMLKLFTVYGKFVNKQKEEYQFWKDGIVISKYNESVLIKYCTEKQSIKLYSSKNSDNRKFQKEIVDFVLDIPEDYSLPKRNFSNHIKKRWIDVMNEDDEDFAPHFSERFEQYPGYYDEFINRNYRKEYLWKSDYFTVFVSFDGEFFAEWNRLNNNSNLKEINFQNIKGALKKIKIKDYYFYINKENPKNKKERTMNTFNFGPNSTFNGSQFGDGNTQTNNFDTYSTNPNVLKAEEILKEFQLLKVENEEWKNIFIEGMKDLIELKEAQTEVEVKESKTTLRKWHDTVLDLGKRLNDWKNITFLGVDFAEKTPKLLDLLNNIGHILKHN